MGPVRPMRVDADPARALDALPPQWTDVALQHFCGPGTRVEINGHPLVPGTAIPAGAFVVGC